MPGKLQRLLCSALRHNLAGGKRPPPEAGRILWSAFAALSSQRSHDMTGPNPITFPEVEAYCRVMRMPLEPHHIAVLIAMDRVWLDHAHDMLLHPADKRRATQVSTQPMTSALFDAMFG